MSIKETIMIQTLLSSFTHFAVWFTSTNNSIFVIALLVILAIAVVTIIAQWKMFEKAGKPGWAAVIPIYNTWTLFEISGKPGWWALIGLIPYIGWLILFVLYIIAALELAKRFGQSTMFAIFGLIVFQIVGIIILGFGDAEYKIPPDEQSFNTPTSE